MSALVDQSVIVAEEATPGYTRYRMLADIRQFGLERAEKDGELHGLMERLATWFPSWSPVSTTKPAGRTKPAGCGGSPGAREPAGRHRVRRRGSGGRRAGLVIARELDLCWSASGSLDEARHWLELGLASGTGGPLERGRALRSRPASPYSRRPTPGPGLVDEGNKVAASGDDSRVLGLLLVPAAMLALWDDTPAVAADQADRAVALVRYGVGPPGELMALFVAGVCHGFAGNSGDATTRHRRCIARADAVGKRHMKALAVAGLGEQHLAEGHLAEAAALFGEAIVLKRELGDRMGMAVGLDSLGRVARPRVR